MIRYKVRCDHWIYVFCFVKYRIKGIPKTEMDKIEAKLKEVVAAKRNSYDAVKIETADNSVRFADIQIIYLLN